MSKILLVTQLSTLNKEGVTKFSEDAKNAFPDFANVCGPRTKNCLRFLHVNADSSLKQYIDEEPMAIVFDADCLPERVIAVSTKIMAARKDSFLPKIIIVGENLVRKVELELSRIVHNKGGTVLKAKSLFDASGVYKKKPKQESVLV